MQECKRIITPNSICSESALDAVCKLIATGMKVQPACKYVATEYQKNYPEDKADWKTLRIQYYRSNPKKSNIKKVYHDTLLEEEKSVTCYTLDNALVTLDVPMLDNSTTNCVVDTTKYITIEEHNKIILEYEKACMADVERLLNEILELKNKLNLFENTVSIIERTPEKSTLLSRQVVYAFIKQKGNTIQCHALKSDNLTNEKLYSLFEKVREDYKTSTPPPAWDMTIINATGIL